MVTHSSRAGDEGSGGWDTATQVPGSEVVVAA